MYIVKKLRNKKIKKRGFTLAEVLITLVIIGVIAAFTVPTIIANSRREATAAAVKKFYSTLSQAEILAKADGNDWMDWADSTSNSVDESDGTTAKDFNEKYLLPYLSYMKTETNGNSMTVYLTDGTSFSNYKGECIDFTFDSNGDKKPNIDGRDKFTFVYCPTSAEYMKVTGRVAPYFHRDINSREKAIQACKEGGYSCTALLAIDGWMFKDDYPLNI